MKKETEEKTALDEIEKLEHLLPEEVLLDVRQRISDWFGDDKEGKEDDDYIKQQLRYVKRTVKYVNSK